MMGVRILHDQTEGAAVMYCSTTGWAFGPLFTGIEGHPDLEEASEEAEAFLTYCNDKGISVRTMPDASLEALYTEWHRHAMFTPTGGEL